MGGSQGEEGEREKRLLWIERERGGTVGKKVKEGWAEGSAGLRVTAKQGQIFCSDPNKANLCVGAFHIRSTRRPCFILRLQTQTISAPPGYSVHSWDNLPYRAWYICPRQRFPVQASFENFIS